MPVPAAKRAREQQGSARVSPNGGYGPPVRSPPSFLQRAGARSSRVPRGACCASSSASEAGARERHRLHGKGLRRPGVLARRRSHPAGVGRSSTPWIGTARSVRSRINSSPCLVISAATAGIRCGRSARRQSEHRRRFQVVVPDVVVRRLEVPAAACRSPRPARRACSRTDSRPCGRPRSSRTVAPTRAAGRPRRAPRSTVISAPHVARLDRSFQLSPSHVSWPAELRRAAPRGAGIVQTSLAGARVPRPHVAGRPEARLLLHIANR